MRALNRRQFLQLTGAASLAAGLPRGLPLPAGGAPHGAGAAEAWLEINLENMAWNLAQIRRRVQRPVMGVIKANAYGHGLVEVGRFLEKQKIDALAVGKFDEALALREAGVKSPLLNFGSYSRELAGEIVRRDISQSVFTDAYRELAEASQALGKPARVHVKVDTGLGRVGVPYYKALPLIEKIAAAPGIKIEGIFTPFTEDDAFDREQLSRLLEVCESAKRKGIMLGLRHAASSDAVISFPAGYLDMVRPGIALYGQYPSVAAYRQRAIDLRPVMALKSRVMYVKTLRPGDAVSYHRAFAATRETPVATVSVGYSDGYPYQAAGKAEVLVRGRRYPSIALVTSNHMSVNLAAAPEVAIGDEVVLFGTQGDARIEAEEVAAWAETSVYKILIWMNPLLPRRYIAG